MTHDDGARIFIRSFLSVATLAAALGGAGCTHNIGYPVGGDDTPRAALPTPYVLAIADFRDRRVKVEGEEEKVGSDVYRFLPDAKLAFLSADFADALVKHLAVVGLYHKVLREAPYERAHLLLAGEIVRFRVLGRKDELARAREATLDATPDKPAPPLAVPTRSDFAVRLVLWRVDKKAPVWTETVAVRGARSYLGDLRAITGLALRDAMNDVVTALARAHAAAKGGRPEHQRVLVNPDARGTTDSVSAVKTDEGKRALSTWVEDQPRWSDVYAAPARFAPFPPTLAPPPLLGELAR